MALHAVVALLHLRAYSSLHIRVLYLTSLTPTYILSQRSAAAKRSLTIRSMTFPQSCYIEKVQNRTGFLSQTETSLRHVFRLFHSLALYSTLLEQIISRKPIYVETLISLRQGSTQRRNLTVAPHHVHLTNRFGWLESKSPT